MRTLLQAIMRYALAIVISIAWASSGLADGVDYYHRHHHPRLTYVEYAPDYSACRTGWWQTLRYGHVRPVWGTWCR